MKRGFVFGNFEEGPIFKKCRDMNGKVVIPCVSGTNFDCSFVMVMSRMDDSFIATFMGRYLSFFDALALSKTCRFFRRCFWNKNEYVRSCLTRILKKCFHDSSAESNISSTDLWESLKWLPVFKDLNEEYGERIVDMMEENFWKSMLHGVKKLQYYEKISEKSATHNNYLIRKDILGIVEKQNRKFKEDLCSEFEDREEAEKFVEALNERVEQENSNILVGADNWDLKDAAIQIRLSSFLLETLQALGKETCTKDLDEMKVRWISKVTNLPDMQTYVSPATLDWLKENKVVDDINVDLPRRSSRTKKKGNVIRINVHFQKFSLPVIVECDRYAETVFDLKKKLSHILIAEDQTLIFDGVKMQNDHLLCRYALTESSKVFCTGVEWLSTMSSTLVLMALRGMSFSDWRRNGWMFNMMKLVVNCCDYQRKEGFVFSGKVSTNNERQVTLLNKVNSCLKHFEAIAFCKAMGDFMESSRSSSKVSCSLGGRLVQKRRDSNAKLNLIMDIDLDLNLKVYFESTDTKSVISCAPNIDDLLFKVEE